MDEKTAYMRKALGFEPDGSLGGDDLVPRAPVGIPNISPFADWDYYYLVRSIGWEPEGDAIGRFDPVEAPRGFVTDLASIPSILWPVMPPTSRYTHAAIIHDYHYWMQTITRKEADEIFSIAMGELGVPGWKASAIYHAVSFAGGGAWDNNAKLREQGECRFLRLVPKDPTITWDDWKSRKDVLDTRCP